MNTTKSLFIENPLGSSNIAEKYYCLTGVALASLATMVAGRSCGARGLIFELAELDLRNDGAESKLDHLKRTTS